MRFYLVDDMHLEFSKYEMPGDKEGILLLAGDICTVALYKEGRTDQAALKIRPRFEQFFHEECAKYKHCYYIAGNHEYYHWSWEETHPMMRKATEGTNVTVLEKELVELSPEIVLFGGTMWTNWGNNIDLDWKNCNQRYVDAAMNYLNDFRLITQKKLDRNGKDYVDNLGPQLMFEDHAAFMQRLDALPKNYANHKLVVMSHHAPSLKSTHPKYGGTNNPVNWAYCSELDNYVAEHPQIHTWVHGHTHDSHDYKINNTRVICNPRGYSYHPNGHDENPRFDDMLCFEV